MRPVRLVSIFNLIAISVFLGLAPAMAEKRVAMVIGISAYHHVPRLQNPVGDAYAIAGLLKGAGFDPILKRDLTGNELRAAMREFADMVKGADVAIFYFAGHGIEIDGINYLIPVDAKLIGKESAEDEAVRLDRVLRSIEAARRLRIVLLDSCRDNPFPSTRSVKRGLANVDVADTLVAFAAKAGSTASDGTGTSNSPFTTALLQHLTTPGLDIRNVLGKVRDHVIANTTPRQEPFVYGSLGGQDILLVTKSSTPSQPAESPLITRMDPCTAAADHWRSVEAIGTRGAYEDHLARFPNCVFAGLAQARLDLLTKNQVATAQPPAAPPVAMQPPAAPSPAVDPSERAWANVQSTTSIPALEDFIRQFGNSRHVPAARARTDELKKDQVAVVVPSQTPAKTPLAIQPPVKVDPCTNVIGSWTWQVVRKATVTFRADRTASNSNIGEGKWSCSNGQYVVTWQDNLSDRFTVSSDGASVAGTGAMGLPLSGTRIGRTNPRQ